MSEEMKPPRLPAPGLGRSVWLTLVLVFLGIAAVLVPHLFDGVEGPARGWMELVGVNLLALSGSAVFLVLAFARLREAGSAGGWGGVLRAFVVIALMVGLIVRFDIQVAHQMTCARAARAELLGAAHRAGCPVVKHAPRGDGRGERWLV